MNWIPRLAANPNTIFVGFEAELRPGMKETLQVKLIPENSKKTYKKIQPLKLWKNI